MFAEGIKYTIKDISVADIIFGKDDLRSRIFFEDLDELARSIRSVGLLNPITVRSAGEKYELIAGFRRLKACEIANLAVIPCRIVDSDDTRADLQKLHENMFREEVNPIDEGNFFKRLLIKNNWRIVDLAVQVHKSPAYVSRRMSLTDADPLLVNALLDKQINISVADELSKIDDPDTRSRLLHYAINSGATIETVRMWRIQYEHDNIQAPAAYVGPGDPLPAGTTNPEPTSYKLGEEPPTEKKIVESVLEFRSCFGCLSKVDAKDVFQIFLCPECKRVIEAALRPAPEQSDGAAATEHLIKEVPK